MQSNPSIFHPGTRTWSKLKTFVSSMKWHRVANAEKDGTSFIREDQGTHQSNRNRVNYRSTKCKAMSMDSQETKLVKRILPTSFLMSNQFWEDM